MLANCFHTIKGESKLHKCVSLNHFPKFPLANYQDGVLALVLYCALLSDNVP